MESLFELTYEILNIKKSDKNKYSGSSLINKMYL